jgi:sugar-specific transcriptional regulator TrmB
MESILSDLGLSKNESKTYLSLLKYGSMQLKDLTKATDLYRQNVLDSLEKLQNKGLISITFKGKRRVYSAVSPSRLKVLLEEKKQKLENALPHLLSIAAQAEKPKIDLFSGREGINTILDDELTIGQTIHVMQSSTTVEARAGSYLSISREKRWRKGMAMKIIFSVKDRKAGEQAAKYPKTPVRYLDEDFGPVTIDVYGNRTVLIFGEEPTIIRITDKDVARRFLGFFEMNWKRAKKKQE